VMTIPAASGRKDHRAVIGISDQEM
jgi:hypothetical protein